MQDAGRGAGGGDKVMLRKLSSAAGHNELPAAARYLQIVISNSFFELSVTGTLHQARSCMFPLKNILGSYRL